MERACNYEKRPHPFGETERPDHPFGADLRSRKLPRASSGQSLQFQDWGIIKPTWKKQFSDPFVTDPYHIIMTGRAGYEYDYERNEDTGKRELHKTGIKMKVEGETAYEPDMLILMERYEEVLRKVKRVWREATIVKDRSTILDGKTIQNPRFENFAPSVKVMLAGGKKAVTQAEADSDALFKTEEEKTEWLRERKKALEEIEGYLVSIWPSTSAKEKQMKSEAIYQAFGTRSWTAVEELSPGELRTGYKKIVAFVSAGRGMCIKQSALLEKIC